MGHQHSHDHHEMSCNARLNKVFIWGITLNAIFVAIEAFMGWKVNSMALMSDAGHNLSDVFSLALAMIAFRLTLVAPNNKYTYGYKKSSVLASLTNAIILVVAVVFIITESIQKISHPEPVNGGLIAWIAAIGILINGLTTYAFFKVGGDDLNIKGAFLHMAADTLVSIGVLISGIIIKYTGWVIIDPIIGIAIGVIILISTWGLLTQSLRLVLDGVPANIDVESISQKISGIDGVKDIHHIHVWAISTTEIALTAHIVTCITDTSQTAILKGKIKELLKNNGISHATLEFELPNEDCHCQDCN